MISAERVLARMVEFIGDRRIEDLPIRCTAVPFDVLARREVWLDTGPVKQALRASIGIQGVITPVVFNGGLLVDGGVLNPVLTTPRFTRNIPVEVSSANGGPASGRVRGRTPPARTPCR